MTWTQETSGVKQRIQLEQGAGGLRTDVDAVRAPMLYMDVSLSTDDLKGAALPLGGPLISGHRWRSDRGCPLTGGPNGSSMRAYKP